MIGLLIAIIYLSFFGLGLPDSMLGASWPTIFLEMDVPVSGAGIISAIVAFGTILSSLASDRITRKLGASKTTAISVAITAFALLGFGVSTKFWHLCLISIPYGLGAGSVDAALNNYVSLHFSSKHMNWLHCMWGLGAAVGPAIMGGVLTGGQSWHLGYIIVSIIQIVISTILFISLPIWKKPIKSLNEEVKVSEKPLSFKEILKIRGVKAVMVTFFAYCALEVTVTLWASSYLNLEKGVDSDTAALWGSLYVLGITVGRAICGFISIKLNDVQMTRLGEGFMVLGLILLFLPLPNAFSLIGLITLGIGSAPVYPSIIHSTPARFGESRSQALIGVQMASAYTGTCLMPPLFGLIANHVSIKLFPLYIAVLAVIMIVMFEVLNKRAGIKKA